MRSDFIDTLNHLIRPRKCVGCREIFNLLGKDFDPNAVFCPLCRSEWERAKILPCSSCRLAAIECTCVPDILKSIPVASVFKFGTVLSADRVIYLLKRSKLKRVYGFAANELAARMISFGRERDLDLSNAVVTHVPRSRRSITKYGFDHGKLLSVSVAERLGIPACSTVRRIGRGKDQKKLSKEQRLNNSSNRFELLRSADVKGKTVIIVDDVITTGATAAACAAAICEGKPQKIVVLCIAKSNKNKEKGRPLKG